MKKIQIIILTLLLMFTINSNIYADINTPETVEWFLYYINRIEKSGTFNSSEYSNNKGYFYSPKFDRYIFYIGDTPTWKFNKDSGKYELVGETFFDTPNGFYTSSPDSGPWIFSVYNSSEFPNIIDTSRAGIYNGSDIIKHDSGLGGGSTTPDGGNNQDNGQSQGLGILNNINNTINSLVRNINSLLSSITNAIKKAVTDILEGIKKILKEFLELLKNMLKELFLPSDDFINDKFTEVKNLLTSKFNLSFIEQSTNQLKNANTSFFNDVYYNNVKVIDMSFLNNSIPHIKKYTDGFFWLLFILFQYNEIYFLIRGTKSLSTSKE